MNEVAMMKSDHHLHLEDDGRALERCRMDCEMKAHEKSSLTDEQNSDLMPCKDTTANSSPVKYKRYGSRLDGVKVRHKRQTLQDMARPLKHWLYKHRDNPYPTKTEKVLLALGSHMTLVQVSNWFANARRRLKNTVRQPDLSWALRIKLYNRYIQGNAERLSVCSDDSNSEDEECPLQTPVSHSDFSRSSSHKGVLQTQGNILTRANSTNSDDGVSPPSKYKSSLLNRYLNDNLRHVMAASSHNISPSHKRRSHSESFSSNECDEDVVSPASSSETDTNFVYHMDSADYASSKCDKGQQQDRGQQGREDQDWREIHAAMALTNLAQGQRCTTEQSCIRVSTAAAPGRLCNRGPASTTRTTILSKICTTGPITTTRQSCSVKPFLSVNGSTLGPTLTSRIIQKSSHISEIKTVKVPLCRQSV
ncbi:homeobox protein Mohawk-like [Lampris incognitus]|uniref:homeobox protein Mohawk-like n=1 Tax=Lampris incognitus TaxID=2546036 RepID=UPI0024B5959C|nr:homeobox protein Mohawk-like [Lampris incognitus]